MGCDIHLFVETKKDGVWVSADTWEEDEDDGRLSVPYDSQFYNDRNYDMFAILANVRNGEGFAGCDTGDGFKPISMPRGIPYDACEQYKQVAEGWGEDGHSHSFLTLAELQAYDWTQTTKHRGYVDAVNFFKWDERCQKNGESPQSYCGGVGGAARTIPREEMARIAAEADQMKGNYQQKLEYLNEHYAHTYTQVEWTQPYYKCCRHFLSDVMPRLGQLGKPEDVRIVFFFDN